MYSYKKTFYFKNNNTFEAEFDTNLKLEQLENYYFKLLKKGKTIIEHTKNDKENNTILINLKDVNIIKIEFLKEI